MKNKFYSFSVAFSTFPQEVYKRINSSAYQSLHLQMWKEAITLAERHLAVSGKRQALTMCSKKLSDTEVLIQAFSPLSHCSKYKLHLMPKSFVELAYDLHAYRALL